MSVLEYMSQQYNKIIKDNNCEHTKNECKCYCHTELGFMHITACCRAVKCDQCDNIYNKVKQKTNK